MPCMPIGRVRRLYDDNMWHKFVCIFMFFIEFFLPLLFFRRRRWIPPGGGRRTIFVYFFDTTRGAKSSPPNPPPPPTSVFVHCVHTTGGDHTPRTRRRCTRMYSRIASWSQRPARAAPRSRSSFLGHVSLRSRSLCITRTRAHAARCSFHYCRISFVSRFLIFQFKQLSFASPPVILYLLHPFRLCVNLPPGRLPPTVTTRSARNRRKIPNLYQNGVLILKNVCSKFINLFIEKQYVLNFFF